MGFVWSCAVKDLRRQLADPFAIAMWLGIPVILAGLIVLAFGGEDTVPKAQLLIADEDSTFVSLLFTGGLQRTPVIETKPSTRAAGRAILERGDATALLVVPKGFGQAVLVGESTTVELVTNPSQRILPRIAEETVGVLADGTWYVTRLLGPALADLPEDVRSGRARPSSEVVARASVRVSELIAKLQPYVVPPAIALVTPEAKEEPSIPGGVGAMFFPGILLMALLFASQGMSADLWEEVDAGTLRRTAATPSGLGALFAGKLLAGAVIMAAVCTIAVAIGVRFFAVPLARLPLAVLWGTLSGATFLCGLLLLQTLASARRTANMLVTFILFPLLMVGGSFFPLDSLPPSLATVGRWTPNGRSVLRLQSILRGDADAAGFAIDGAAFAVVAAVAIALAIARTRRRFVKG